MTDNNDWHTLQTQFDILAEHQGIKIDEKFILKSQKGTKNVIKEVKDSCKVLHFSSEWNFEEVLTAIDKLDSKDYPQLFIFVIEATNFEFNAANQDESLKNSLKLQEKLTNFDFTRPMILQMTSEAENVRNIWFKNKNSNQFTVIEQQQEEPDQPNALSSFLRFFMNSFNNSELDILNYAKGLENRALTVRFLRALNLSNGFFGGMILNFAASGTKDEFIAALDAPFDSNGRMLSIRAQEYIADVFGDNADNNPENDDSVLLKAISNNNKDVINYLITYWSHLIQLLPIEHQIKISTAVFDTNQLDILCDLITIADFPFSKDFKVDSVEHPRLKQKEAERTEFKTAIKAEDFGKINEFIKNNRNLKFIYSSSNKSALTEAIKLKKFSVFYYLKSLGLKGEDCDEILKKLSEKRRKQAVKQAAEQRKKNISQSQDIAPKSVMKLLMRSTIHKSRTDKEQQTNYRDKIMKWLTDIHKVASELVDVAATCEDLKIIFDFESDSVENASLTGSMGISLSYPISKRIFIAAKLTDTYGNITMQREQKIKGCLAHELCHIVMRLVYDNNDCPYYKHREDIKIMFEAIAQAINKWTKKDLEDPEDEDSEDPDDEDSKDQDDECNGIISSVFTAYAPQDLKQELITKVVQILSQFDDFEEKPIYLREKYKMLFDFWFNQIVPELQIYLQRNKDIIRLNRTIGLFNSIKNQKYELCSEEKIEKVIRSNLVIVQTNVPKLLFINIHNYLKKKDGILLDSKNLFIDPNKLCNEQLMDDFKRICSENQEINIFVDCYHEIPENLGNIVLKKKLKFYFVVPNDVQCDNLNKIFKELKIQGATKMEVNYNWNNLTDESQNLLLNLKINFQNNSNVSLKDLVRKECNREETIASTAVDSGINDLINDQLLNLLLENQQVLINITESFEKKFEVLYKSRSFIKKTTIVRKVQEQTINDEIFKNDKEDTVQKQEISQDELFSEVKSKKYVLISDIAGNGKSWAMKNFTKILKEQTPSNWVTYVDLKQYIDEFKAQKDEPEFSAVMVKHILKLQHQFEAKIFQKLYKDGKVFILFDGFDEIAPNCAEFVSKLAQSFQQNGGNQLWIATRDFFEVDLKKKLKIDVAYSLNEMSEDEGVDLIARSWMLKDLRKDKQEPIPKQIFNEHLKVSLTYKSYQQKAHTIVKKALISTKYNKVGWLQLFQMIADEFKDEENVDDLQKTKIYEEFIDVMYKRWTEQKGKLRNKANIKSQRFKLNFYKFHQFHAILSLYPELAKILFPGYDSSEWPQDEIIACGILTIIDGKVYFIHETLREYFAADAIAKALKKLKLDENVVEIFVKVLTVEKFGVIRVFLNDMITNVSILKKIQPQVEKHIENFCKMTSLADFFTSNLHNLVDLVLDILKTGNYKQIKKILQDSAESIAKYSSDSKIFQKFQVFTFEYLRGDDLQDLIIKGEVFLGIIKSGLEIEIFEDFVAKTEAKFDRKFVRQALMLVSDYLPFGNIFYFLAESSNSNAQKVQIFLKIIVKFFTVTEIFELMSKCNEKEQNILHVCVKSKKIEENLKILWTEIEKYFTEQNLPQSFKEFAKQQDKYKKNILHCVVWRDKIEVHETFWELLLKLIKDQEELKDFILQKNYGDYFVHDLVRKNKNPAIIELTFKILKENFSDAQYQEILTLKGYNERNLLQSAAWESKVVEVHQFLWKFFRDFCGADEKFLEMLNEVDNIGQNILHIAAAAWNSSSEVFEFLIQELEKIASRDEIREILRNLNRWNENLMQLAAENNKYLEFHKTLWKTLRKYFTVSEILQFIKNVDISGENFLSMAIRKNTKEIVEQAWNELESFLTLNEKIELLEMKFNKKDILTISFSNEVNPEVYDYLKTLLRSIKLEIQYKNSKVDAELEANIDFSDIEQTSVSELIEAVKESNIKKVENLLITIIDVNEKDDGQLCAIDYAWMNFKNFEKSNPKTSQMNNEIILKLLAANSKFPSWRVGFNCVDASKEVRDLVNFNESLHRDLINGTFENIIQIITENPHLRYFFNRINESLFLLGLKREKFEFLNKLNGEISIVEDENAKEMYYEPMDVDGESDFNEPKLPPAHLLILIAKSRVINSKQFHKCWNYISNAYKSLNEVKSCSLILQVAALSRNLRIIFDFSNNFSKGIIHQSDHIYIGAEDLMDIKDRNKVLGVLIHELCHIAVLLTYMNNYNPFPIGESEVKNEYIRIFNKIKQRYVENRKIDGIIKDSFNTEDDKQYTELIVRPYHLIIHYLDNSAMINQLQKTYEALFNFVRDILEPEIERTLPNLKKLYDEKKYLMFEELTVPIRSKLLNSKIIFQGYEMTFINLFGNNEEAMNFLGSDDIRKILLKCESLVIGEDLKDDTEKWKFDEGTQSTQNLEVLKYLRENFDSNLYEVKNVQIFSISEYDKFEESDFLLEIAKTLKINNRTSWVSIINRKDLQKKLFQVRSNVLNIEKFLLKILNIESETETDLFKEFYRNGKLILLFAGFDEIAKEYFELLLIMFKEIQQKNELWIFTKPQLAERLRVILNMN